MDEFDLYWRKCSCYRLNQIKDMKNSLDIFTEWPEYKKPSGYQLVNINFLKYLIIFIKFLLQINIDFCIKYPKAKNIGEKWDQYSTKLFGILKAKIVNSTALALIEKVKTSNEGKIIYVIVSKNE